MKYYFIEYPKCSTCKNAKKWLEENKVEFEDRNIVEEPPKVKELREWIKKSGLPIKKFFNTSGILYKQMNLKETLPKLTVEEQIGILASNGMLVKRPLLIGNGKILIGFKKEGWERIL